MRCINGKWMCRWKCVVYKWVLGDLNEWVDICKWLQVWKVGVGVAGVYEVDVFFASGDDDANKWDTNKEMCEFVSVDNTFLDDNLSQLLWQLHWINCALDRFRSLNLKSIDFAFSLDFFLANVLKNILYKWYFSWKNNITIQRDMQLSFFDKAQ